MSINSRFVEIRKYLKLSQQKFADSIDVIKQTINGIENDKYKPSTEVLTKVLKKYPSIDAKWLMTGEGEMFISPENLNYANEPHAEYKNNYKDRLIESLEKHNKYLEQEIERLKKEKENN